MIYLGGSLISWRTRLQMRVAHSTAEAEYREASMATRHIIWLRRLLRELEISQEKPTVIHEDNRACIKMIENPIISERNKHVEIDCHFIRDQHELGNIKMVHIATDKQTADILTKNLNRTTFERHRSRMVSRGTVGLRNHPVP